jgi:hypothetical protein
MQAHICRCGVVLLEETSEYFSALADVKQSHAQSTANSEWQRMIRGLWGSCLEVIKTT